MSGSPNHPEAVAVDLEEGESLLKSATPGPWLNQGWDFEEQGNFIVGKQPSGMVGATLPQPTGEPNQAIADAALIVWAINALPALLASVREAGELRQRLAAAKAEWPITRDALLACDGMGYTLSEAIDAIDELKTAGEALAALQEPK